MPIFSNALVIACGAVTSILTAFVLFAVEQKCGFSFYSFTFWYVIPIGTIGHVNTPINVYNLTAEDTEAPCLSCGAVIPAGVTACPQCGWTYKSPSQLGAQ